MRKTQLKQCLSSNKLTLGSWITLAHSAIPEIMAAAGFDWLTVDMEHSAITLDQAQTLIQVIELAGAAPLVRVSENNPVLIKRVMDAGAHGVIVPNVNTREEAIAAVKAVRYPPVGNRGVGLGRAQGYGVSFDSYAEWLSKNSVVVVQIEHIQAVNNIEAIVSVEGVDAFFVGPYDLSASLGTPGQFDNPKMAAAMDKLHRTAKELKVTAGIHVVQPDANEVIDRINQGYRFIAFSLDTLFLSQGVEKVVAIRESFAEA